MREVYQPIAPCRTSRRSEPSLVVLYDRLQHNYVLCREEPSMRMTSRFVACFVLSVIVCDLVRAENWTRFRGPNGQGISREVALPVEWS